MLLVVSNEETEQVGWRWRAKLTCWKRSIAGGKVFMSMFPMGVMQWPHKTAHGEESSLSVYWGQRAQKSSHDSNSQCWFFSLLLCTYIPKTGGNIRQPSVVGEGVRTNWPQTSSQCSFPAWKGETLITFIVWAKTYYFYYFNYWNMIVFLIKVMRQIFIISVWPVGS